MIAGDIFVIIIIIIIQTNMNEGSEKLDLICTTWQQ